MTAKADAIEQIRQEIVNLDRSPLYEYRTKHGFQPVIGAGSLDAAVVFVGEAPGEREVLAHLAEGLSNSAIGATLTVSENTVRFHLKNIYEKLQVSNRTEAVAWYFRTYRKSS